VHDSCANIFNLSDMYQIIHHKALGPLQSLDRVTSVCRSQHRERERERERERDRLASRTQFSRQMDTVRDCRPTLIQIKLLRLEANVLERIFCLAHLILANIYIYIATVARNDKFVCNSFSKLECWQLAC